MCASFEAKASVTQLVRTFESAGAPIEFPNGLPNIAPLDEVRPTDAAFAVRAASDTAVTLSQMRFGFPPSAPKRPPIINLRSEGREVENRSSSGRCIVPVTGFYEFTGTRYPKTRWLLSGTDGALLGLAAVWRSTGEGVAFALLTAEPGPDIAPYHDRGVLPLVPANWADWLFARRPVAELLAPPPAGTLKVEAAPRPPKA